MSKLSDTGAYLIIRNRFDALNEVLSVYTKRWRIEVFFRVAKQELGLNHYHSITEIHHHAHIELLFAAETLLNYARWYENKGKTSKEEVFTHGEMVHSLFHTRCEIWLKTKIQQHKKTTSLTEIVSLLVYLAIR